MSCGEGALGNNDCNTEQDCSEENTSDTKHIPCIKLENLDSTVYCNLCYSSVNDPLEYGDLYQLEGITVHYFCLLFSSSLVQNGEDHEGILGFFLNDIKKEIKRGSRLRCNYCKKRGATVGCHLKSCKKTFHLPCGLKNDSMHQFFDQFRSFCSNHRPSQKVDDIYQKTMAADEEAPTCPICYESVSNRVSNVTLWAPCCKKRWFHRNCLQRQALAQGYFFKCPMCNNKDEFNKEMKKFGVYIPEMDAAWEREPDAFQDLLQIYSRCDARVCKCPKGRQFGQNTGSWRLLRCNSCGSQGTHIICGALKIVSSDSSWRCPLCSQVLSAVSRRWISKEPTDQKPQTSEGPFINSATSVTNYRRETSNNPSSQRRQAELDIETQANKRRKSSPQNLDSTASGSSSHTMPGPSRITPTDEDEIIVVDDSDSDVEVLEEADSPTKPDSISKLNSMPPMVDKALFTREGKMIQVHKVTAKGDTIPVEKGKLGAVENECKENSNMRYQATSPEQKSDLHFKIDNVRHSNELFSVPDTDKRNSGGKQPTSLPFPNQSTLAVPQQIYYVPVTVDGQPAMQPVLALPQVPLQQLHQRQVQDINQNTVNSVQDSDRDSPELVILN